jgi:hypothetical protein
MHPRERSQNQLSLGHTPFTRSRRHGNLRIPSRGMVYFAGPASGRLIVYHAQSSSDPAGIGAGSVSPCNFRMDCWLK